MKEISFNDLKTNLLKWANYVESYKKLGVTKYGKLKLIIYSAKESPSKNSNYKFSPILKSNTLEETPDQLLQEFLSDREEGL